MKKWWISFGLIVLTISALGRIESVDSYIQSVKQRDGTNHVTAWKQRMKQSDELYQRIAEEAAKLEEKPADARIDRVWKAIPGYNGIRVDIDKTYELAKASKEGRVSFVFQEVAPAISVEDLPPNPIYKGNSRKAMAAIMINVAWGDEFLPSILQTLQKENVRATFFFDGTWLSKNIEKAKEIGEKGHELSNHAWSHKKMSQLGHAETVAEIEKTEKLLRERLGVNNRWFAPPSGDFNSETVRIARSMGLQTVLWTIDTVDWRKPEPSWIVNRISSRIEPGAMILMHPTASSSAALEDMIRSIKAKGLALGTVSELLSPNRLQLPQHELSLQE